jgi:hypothetical protein
MGVQHNTEQGNFGETWLEVIAAAAGMTHSRSTPDVDKADIDVTLLEELRGVYHPSVKVQVKTELGLTPDADGVLRYRLDATTYDFLRRMDHGCARALVVFGLDRSGERVRLEADGTLLCGIGRWANLYGMGPAPDKSVVIDLPAANMLDTAGIREMVVKCGVRQSTQGDESDVWGDQ